MLKSGLVIAIRLGSSAQVRYLARDLSALLAHNLASDLSLLLTYVLACASGTLKRRALATRFSGAL